MTCKIIYKNGKWHCVDETGKNWYAFDRRDWAVECAKANNFAILSN